MPDVPSSKAMTLLLPISVLLFLNVAGWFLFPVLMLAIVPLSSLALFAIGVYLKSEDQ